MASATIVSGPDKPVRAPSCDLCCNQVQCTSLHRYGRSMALEHAILVSLTERAGSGYELARRFDRSIGYFWPATHQQIYRVLRRMDEAGWVTHTEVAQEGRPDKKVYRISDGGLAELTRWIAEPGEVAILRDALGVK